MQKLLCSVLCALCLYTGPVPCGAQPTEMIVTYRAPESEADARYDYDTALLRLALEETRDDYGDYRLVPSPIMNYSRALSEMKAGTYDNFFMKMSYSNTLAEGGDASYVPFPVDLGIVGYRVCFASPAAAETLRRNSDMVTLKKLKHIQGTAWVDVEILRHNGFQVEEAPDYDGLFYMIAKKRGDLLCRGVNEILKEYDARKGMRGLVLDTTIAFSYDLPRFYFTNKSNTVALKRITDGILRAYKDKSLQRLWQAEYGESVAFANLSSRTIIRLENPFLKGINFDYRQYMFSPGKQ